MLMPLIWQYYHSASYSFYTLYLVIETLSVMLLNHSANLLFIFNLLCPILFKNILHTIRKFADSSCIICNIFKIYNHFFEIYLRFFDFISYSHIILNISLNFSKLSHIITLLIYSHFLIIFSKLSHVISSQISHHLFILNNIQIFPIYNYLLHTQTNLYTIGKGLRAPTEFCILSGPLGRSCDLNLGHIHNIIHFLAQ